MAITALTALRARRAITALTALNYGTKLGGPSMAAVLVVS